MPWLISWEIYKLKKKLYLMDKAFYLGCPQAFDLGCNISIYLELDFAY